MMKKLTDNAALIIEKIVSESGVRYVVCRVCPSSSRDVDTKRSQAKIIRLLTNFSLLLTINSTNSMIRSQVGVDEL